MKNITQLKQLTIILGLIAFISLNNFSIAKESPVNTIEKKVEQLRLAMINKDGKMLTALSSPLLSYGHSGGFIQNQQAFIEQIASGKSDFVSMSFDDQSITMSGNTALVRHTLNAHTNDGGIPKDISLKILLVWQLQKGEWKLLARQAVKAPVETVP